MNKYIKFSITLILSLLVNNNVFSQQPYGYYKDVLKFSHYFNGGSARVQAIGGASYSLGGDISSISLNPAGIGFFNKKIFSLSYNSKNIKNNSFFIGESSSSQSSLKDIDNISILLPVKNRSSYFNTGLSECPECPKLNIGLSFTRIKDFGNDRYYRGYNDNNSIIDYFLYDAQGVPLSQISNSEPISGIGLLQEAYDHYLINPDLDLPGSYFSFVGGFPLQEERIINEGGINKFSLSAGTNIKDKIFLGIGTHIYFINYEQTRMFAESQYEILNENGVWESEGILDFIKLNDFFKIKGNGFSTSIGIIFKPINELNIGLNFETKTKYLLKEELESELETNYFNYYFQPEDTTLGNSISGTALSVAQYNFTSPSKFTIASSYFIYKYGFISADIDFINYSGARIQSYDFNHYNDNQEIVNLYKSLAINYRFGIEARLKKFYLRAGYNYLTDPNRISDNINNDKIKKSIGLGYLSKGINLDIAYTSLKTDSRLSSYPYPFNQPFANFSTKVRSVIMTLGIRINNR